MVKERLTLFIAGVVVVVAFFMVPATGKWLDEKIVDHYSILKQVRMLDIEDRRDYRYGYPGIYYKLMARHVNNPETAVVLFPAPCVPGLRQETEFVVPEPAVFYYFTGVKSVWANSPDAQRANYEVYVGGPGKVLLIPITSKVHLDSLIAIYKPLLP